MLSSCFLYFFFRYVQIVVSKLRSNATPTYHPGNNLQPYDAKTVDNQPYIAAQLDGTNINQNSVFTVGDDKKYASSNTRKRRSTNYQNVQLEPETYYSVFQRTFQYTVSCKLFHSEHENNLKKICGAALHEMFVPVLTESVLGKSWSVSLNATVQQMVVV